MGFLKFEGILFTDHYYKGFNVLGLGFDVLGSMFCSEFDVLGLIVNNCQRMLISRLVIFKRDSKGVLWSVCFLCG
jgi:hypothetical protein